MDYKKRDKNWISQLGSLFGEQNATETDNRDIKDLKLNIKDLLHKRTKVWWNKAALENYLQRDIIPRGLRIQIHPTSDISDPTFANRWEESMNKCSRTLLELLIGADRKALDSIEGEIETLKNKIQSVLPVEDCNKFDKELDAELNKWEKEIQEFKVRKFQRDLQDYSTNRIYKWQYKKAQRKPISRSSSVTSLRSEESCGEPFLGKRGGSKEGGNLEQQTHKPATPLPHIQTRNYNKRYKRM
ncbi:uncharacterized protein [Ranitomeya imitator]|uniref:uncharacterized protein n=1 Tax=Ranitomeya imitator TaxID=111125 RepID=UPI0037E8B5A7